MGEGREGGREKIREKRNDRARGGGGKFLRGGKKNSRLFLLLPRNFFLAEINGERRGGGEGRVWKKIRDLFQSKLRMQMYVFRER